MLHDLRRRHPEAREMAPDPEGHVHHHPARRKLLHRAHVQVIVVIVRDQHRVERRQSIERQKGEGESAEGPRASRARRARPTWDR